MTFIITSNITEDLYPPMSYYLFSFIKKKLIRDVAMCSVYIDPTDGEFSVNR